MNSEISPAIAAIMAAGPDLYPDHGIDFRPFPRFEDADETASWVADWGTPDAPSHLLHMLGDDGTGGRVALWAIRDGEPLEQQPVVFLGSEGDTAVLARDAADLLWLLAHGRGPVELLHMDEDDEDQPGPHPELMAAARELAPDRDRPVEQIRTDAATVAAELPDLVEWLGPPR